ncbi:MAG: hypothetical protein IKW78_05525 [Prevotella sp.]|nr:hypothetical protein [Prevotella sp.]
MKQKIFMLLAAVLLSSANLFAQSSEPLKGDVNEDGVVDVADVVAVIDIIAKSQNDSETTYYWYVGQTDPSTMSSIDPVVNDSSSPGWRLIGTNLPEYSSSNMLWNSSNTIGLGSKTTWYLALPKNTIKVYSAGIDLTSDLLESTGTKVINGATYYIYSSKGTTRNLGYDIY